MSESKVKDFNIKHPTKEGKRLRHGCIEGAEYAVYFRGKSRGKKINLPEYWTKLVDHDTITVQLTPIRFFQQLWVEKIEDNQVFVGSDQEEIHYFYLIQAERIDVSKIEVEY